MALVLANRVQESGTANTTVSFTLTGAVPGFQSFGAVGNGNTTYYSATDTAGNWEVGIGTYSTTGPTLTRTSVYASSNSNLAVTFSGTVNVFLVYPASKSVNLDASDNVSALGTISSGTWQGSAVQPSYGGTGLTTFSGANRALYSTGASALTAGILPVAAGGTGTATPGLTAGSNVTITGSWPNQTIASTSAAVATPTVRGILFGSSSSTTYVTALGYQAGQTSQGSQSVAVGYRAGQSSQADCSVAIGYIAGQTTQGIGTIAVGGYAGQTSQSLAGVAIGNGAGTCSQGQRAIAIGSNAGNYLQGAKAIAIGCAAGITNQHANTIAIGACVSTDGPCRTFVSPIRNATTAYRLYYNPTTKEITYG